MLRAVAAAQMCDGSSEGAASCIAMSHQQQPLHVPQQRYAEHLPTLVLGIGSLSSHISNAGC